jgi:hypothetical protein
VTISPDQLAAGKPIDTAVAVRPRLRTALAVLVAGAAVVVAGAVPGGVSVARSTHPVVAGVMPAVTTVHLTPGTWEVFIAGDTAGIDPQDLAVGVRGVVPHSVEFGAERSYRGRSYNGQVTFTTKTTANVRLALEGTPDARYFIARSYVSGFERAGAWWAVAGGGLAVVIVGLMLLLVGGSRRRSTGRAAMASGGPWQPGGSYQAWQPSTAYQAWQQPPAAQSAPVGQPAWQPPPPAGPPPGWYPDPAYASTGKRWWDGTRWTEHLQAP